MNYQRYTELEKKDVWTVEEALGWALAELHWVEVLMKDEVYTTPGFEKYQGRFERAKKALEVQGEVATGL